MAKIHFNIGANVRCEDGVCGRLSKLVLDPREGRVTDLIVQKGLLLKKDRVLPVSAVQWATDEEVFISAYSKDIEGYPAYREVDFREPAMGWGEGQRQAAANTVCWTTPYGSSCREGTIPMVRRHTHEGISPTLQPVGRGTPVYGTTGSIGKVDHILVDQESGEINHLIVRRGMRPDYVIVPMDLVAELHENRIVLKVGKSDLQGLRPYYPRDDAELLSDLHRQFGDTGDGVRDVDVSVKQGVVQLSGRVRDEAVRMRAEELARAVVGVVDVENALDVSGS
jgi:uncharacterized protein YrrD